MSTLLQLQVKRVVLAYSGGLDTSIIIPWLRENYGCEVIAMVGNVGQGDDYAAVRRKALASGAAKVFVEDLREEFVTGPLWKAVKTGTIYEGKYLLGTSLARPVLAKAQVKVALEQGADAVAHGCTGKGNDQVRFELAYKALAPHLHVIAPWREWSIKSREDALDYAESHDIPVPVTKKDLYSRDQNLWHISHEGGPLETQLGEPPEDAWKLTVNPQNAPGPGRNGDHWVRGGRARGREWQALGSRQAGRDPERNWRPLRRGPHGPGGKPPGGNEIPRRVRDARRHADLCRPS